MKVLFDQGVPVPLRREIPGHVVDTLFERGWSNLTNGKLLDAAEAEGSGLLLTTDQNLKYQQNLSARRIAILVLLSTAWPKIRGRVPAILSAVDAARPGTLEEIPI